MISYASNDCRTSDDRRRKPVRFNLRALFLLPLLISPLFLSSVFVRKEVAGDAVGFTHFFNLLASSALYAAVFAARSMWRTRGEDRPDRRYVLTGSASGACYGILFMAQVGVPLLAAAAIGSAHRWQVSIFDLQSLVSFGILRLLATGAGTLTLFGVVTGAFGGSIAGIVLEWRYSRNDAV